MPEMPKYHLVDVPHDLRCRVLDLCCRRLLDDALELLRLYGFNHYTRDDLVKFYIWAPDPLPNQVPEPEPTLDNPRDYPPPSPELLGDICKRLNELPPELAQQVDQDLRIKGIEQVGKFLWDAGFPFTTADLREYRKSLFPPNAMVNAYTPGPPVLRQEFAPQASQNCESPHSETHAPVAPSFETLSAPACALSSLNVGSPNPSATTTPPIQQSSNPPPDACSPVEDQPPNIEPAPSLSEVVAAGNGQPTTENDPSSPGPSVHESTDPGIDPSIQESTNPDTNPPSPAPPPVIPKRRGKISGLPKAVRQRVNEMLDEGSTFEAIIEWLDQNGFPSINKVNMHNWHKGGFQDWLREQERIENQTAQREWLGDIITQSEPGDLHHCIYTLFASQIMDSLFGIDTAKLKAGLAARPRDYIALMNGFRRMDKELTAAPEFQEFLKRKRQRKEGGGLPPDVAYAILRELRLSQLVERALECDEFKDRRKVKPG